MKEFEIWMGGYAATGEQAGASFLAKIEAETFHKAVEKYLELHPEYKQHYAREERYVSCKKSDEHPLGRKLDHVHKIGWCYLYDNEKDARAING
jgi:hypothetical protein